MQTCGWYRPRRLHCDGGILMRLLSWIVVIAMLTIFVLLSQRGLKPLTPQGATVPVAVVTNATIDAPLAATLARIKAGERLPFPHDGSVFENRERRLPVQPPGYYREFVFPTPGADGPGARRIVLGRGGEYYLSLDHYEHFTRVK